MSIVQETGFIVGTGTSTSVSFSLRNVSQASCTLNIHVSRYYMHLNVIIIIKHMNILCLLSECYYRSAHRTTHLLLPSMSIASFLVFIRGYLAIPNRL